MNPEADFALFNVGQLVTCAPGCHQAAEGPLGVIPRGAIAARGTDIVWVGPMDDLQASVRLHPEATIVNSHGRVALPGFVDPHTHPVFAGDRSRDFYARAAGASYSDQLEESGIMSTVRATRGASEDDLLGLAYRRAESFLRHGTTTVEAKSGYGLTLEDELKSLRVLNHLQQIQPLKVVPAFLGAHVVPHDYSGGGDAFVNELVEEWLPQARAYADICDVWCEAEAFTAEQCALILERALKHGYKLTVHANELGPGEGVKLAARLGALSVDHAVYLDETDIAALRESKTVAVLLPGTSFFLGSGRYAPARALIDGGVTVAVGTDFNPGTSHTQNMQFVLSLAVLQLGMSPEEAIFGATINAAQAIGLQDRVGSIEPGKFCDFTIFAADDYRHIPYTYAMNLAETVVCCAEVVVNDGVTLARPSPLVRAS